MEVFRVKMINNKKNEIFTNELYLAYMKYKNDEYEFGKYSTRADFENVAKQRKIFVIPGEIHKDEKYIFWGMLLGGIGLWIPGVILGFFSLQNLAPTNFCEGVFTQFISMKF